MSFLPRTPKRKEVPKKVRHATQDKTKRHWCRNCFNRVKLTDVKCSQCEVLNLKPLDTKPKGVKL